MRNLILVLVFFSVLACSKSSLSERDAKKEQLKSAADTKRKELLLVAGLYQGTLTQNSGPDRYPTLKLEVKDIPSSVEGQVDPVLTPILTGYLRFELGEQSFISFSVEKADYDPKTAKLDLVVSNPDYKEVIFAFRFKSPNLTGTWTAPFSSSSGEASLTQVNTQTGSLNQELKGDYYGVLTREKEGLYQYAQLTLSTAVQPPQGLKVSAVLRLIFGDLTSTEYLTYKFDPVQFNPMTGQLVLKAEGTDIILSGNWSKEEFKGEWSTSYTGKMGLVQFNKNATPASPAGKLALTLKGTYQGKLKTTNPQSNLPEKMMVSFVTSQDLSKPNGIAISGSSRFYFGDFESLEYIEYPFSDVQYNFFTNSLTTRIDGDYKLTLKGSTNFSNNSIISGTLSADALGEVGSFELEKK